MELDISIIHLKYSSVDRLYQDSSLGLLRVFISYNLQFFSSLKVSFYKQKDHQLTHFTMFPILFPISISKYVYPYMSYQIMFNCDHSKLIYYLNYFFQFLDY